MFDQEIRGHHEDLLGTGEGREVQLKFLWASFIAVLLCMLQLQRYRQLLVRCCVPSSLSHKGHLHISLPPLLSLLPLLQVQAYRTSLVNMQSQNEEASTGSRLKIYTRTGDKGTSSLYNGERRSKDDTVFEALGTCDELTSYLGLCLEYCEESDVPLTERLEKIQCCLQDVNSNIATPRNSTGPYRLKKTAFDPNGVLAKELEHWIDEYTVQLPPLTEFILPGGGKASASLHYTRTLCRRAERRVVLLVEGGEADQSVQVYLNRLSDFLFTAARWSAAKTGRKDRTYKQVAEVAEQQ